MSHIVIHTILHHCSLHCHALCNLCFFMLFWLCFVYFIFFFTQKTAYELLRSLVGSEMCIRDSAVAAREPRLRPPDRPRPRNRLPIASESACHGRWRCPLYTSDAADDLLCVDLGGRRSIKKKNNNYDSHSDISYFDH